MSEKLPQIRALHSRIEAVTVYRSGAMVERVAALEGGGPAGVQSVTLAGLPLCMQDGSVRVRVEGDGRLPVARDTRVVLEVGVAEADLAPPQNEALVAKRLETLLAEDHLSQLVARRSRIAGVTLHGRPAGEEGKPPSEIPTSARLALVGFQATELETLDAEIATARQRTVDVREQLDELEAREHEASSARQPKAQELRKSVVVTLDTGDHDNARIVVSYMVPGAQWVPAYTLNLAPDRKRGELGMRAAVVQKTGEDWTGVSLTLTTAQAHRWTELPEMQSLRIGRQQPAVRPRGWREPPVGADELYRAYDMFKRKLPRPNKPKPRPRKTRRPPPPPPIQPQELAAEVDFAYSANMTLSGSIPMPPSAPMPVAAAPARAPAQGRRRAAPARAKKMASFGGLAEECDDTPGAGGGAPEGFAEPEPSMPGDLLAYGDLRMRAADAPRRGNLVLLQARERYREWLVMREHEVSFDVVVLVDQATHAAQAVQGVDLPPRHTVAADGEGFAHAYRADAEVEIASDGQYHSVALTTAPVDTHLRHVVVPRESSDVFRALELRNPSKSTWFSGPVDISVAGNYLLTSTMRTCHSGGKVELGLGVEQAIKVSRNTQFNEETAGLMGGSLKLHHTIDIEVANRMAQGIDIEVRERVPTVRDGDEDINFEIESVEPRWREYDPELYLLKGGHRWVLELAAGEKRSLRAAYAVKISSRRELVGGNRRE